MSDAEAAAVARSLRRWVAVVAFVAGLGLFGLAAIGLEVTATEGPVWALLVVTGAVVALAALLRALAPVSRAREGSEDE
jgi:uncharacterized membrane protein